MKKNLLRFAALGSLLLWLGTTQAASPRFNNWGEWQDKDVETVVQAAAKPAANAPVKKSKQNKQEKPVTAKPVAKTSKPKPPISAPAVLGPPTKGRRITASEQDDRKVPTPASKVIISRGKNAKSKVSEDDDGGQNLSWWERWKRKREGRSLTPVIIPESHVYTVRLQEAQWTVAATRLECKLYQAVPRLGKVMFQQKIGSGLEFSVKLDRAYEQIHQASFTSMPTTWGHQSHRRDMMLPASMQQASVTIPREGAMRLINELLEGMAPRMTYRMGDQEASDEVVVTLSALTFAEKLPVFQACIDNLLPFKFDEVKESIVFFKFDSAKLTNKAKKALARVAEYVRLDDGVKRIVIEGHTDSKGFRRYNYRLATKRAKAVEKFFLDKGVSKSRLQVRSKAYGEKKPAASNKSAKGRAQNRRVHVSLYK